MNPRFSIDRMIDEATLWIGANWLEIAIASAAGAAIYLLLNLVRGWSVKLCQRGEGAASWYSILGRAFGRTGQIFMILVAARLVVGYADAPAWLTTTVATLFTISAVFQGALWAREVVFGAIEHRMRDQEHNSRALMSALGIIRLLVTISLFAIALVVVLSNLGVNVTGLVTGLGIGGIAIGLAAQGIFADLFAALAILFDRPFALAIPFPMTRAPARGQLNRSVSSRRGFGAGPAKSGLSRTRSCWTSKSSTRPGACATVSNSSL